MVQILSSSSGRFSPEGELSFPMRWRWAADAKKKGHENTRHKQDRECLSRVSRCLSATIIRGEGRGTWVAAQLMYG